MSNCPGDGCGRPGGPGHDFRTARNSGKPLLRPVLITLLSENLTVPKVTRIAEEERKNLRSGKGIEKSDEYKREECERRTEKSAP